MKHAIYSIVGILAIGASLPALANPAPVVRSQPPAMNMQQPEAGSTVTTTTRTVVIRETPIFGQQIVAALDNRSDTSVFRDLIAANGLSTSLRENGKGYTAFVPLDKAFDKSGMPMPGSTGNGTVDGQARMILENHVVDSKFDVNLLHGNRDNVTTLSGKDITISRMGRNYYANGHLIVSRQHDPEGIIYFTEDLVTAQEFSSAVYNPADVRK